MNYNLKSESEITKNINILFTKYVAYIIFTATNIFFLVHNSQIARGVYRIFCGSNTDFIHTPQLDISN